MAAAAGCCYMDGPSRGPNALLLSAAQRAPSGLFGQEAAEEKCSEQGGAFCARKPRGAAPTTSRAPLAPHKPHRRRLRGVCSAGPTGGPPPGAVHPAGTSLVALASGAGLLRLAKKSTGDSARSRSRQGLAGEPKRESGGGAGGWPAGVGCRPRPRQGPRRVSFVYVAAQCAV